MKKLYKYIVVLLGIYGCKSDAQLCEDAWIEEGQMRGHNKEFMNFLRIGQEARYSCGCKYVLPSVGGKFTAYPIPPPVRCMKHNTPMIGIKFPEEWDEK